MKINLEFDLSKDEDNHKFEMFNNANASNSFIYELEMYLRTLNKYDSDRVEKLNGLKTLEEIVDKFYELKTDLEVKDVLL